MGLRRRRVNWVRLQECFLFPFLMHWHGLLSAELTAAVVSALGMVITLLMLPETKGKSLEELS